MLLRAARARRRDTGLAARLLFPTPLARAMRRYGEGVMKSCLALLSGEPNRLPCSTRSSSRIDQSRRWHTLHRQILAWLGSMLLAAFAATAQAAPNCYRYGGAWENN